MQNLVPPRALLGGPAVDACFTGEQLSEICRPKWSSPQLVLKSWADGTRSVYEITRRAIYETCAAQDRLVTETDLRYALTVLKHYAEQGLVELYERER